MSKEYETLKKNDDIIFINNIYQEANEDGPRQLLATRNEKGTFLGRTEWYYECTVKNSDGFEFNCHEDEFMLTR